MPSDTEKKDVRELLCAGSDDQLDAAVHPMIRAWDDPATALQILEVLDLVIHDALGSGFVVRVLEALYEVACKREGVTHEQVAAIAPWRGEDGRRTDV